jgi:hypothetical protein
MAEMVIPTNLAQKWGGSADMYCEECRCRRHHYHIQAGEVWIFDHCYHEWPASEPVRLLAALFDMLNPHPGSS